MTKIRMGNLMLKSNASKRDLGQCEVSRLLMSESLYHSSFNYLTINTDLDSRKLNLDRNVDSDCLTTKKSIIDCYADRKNNQEIQHLISYTIKLIDFCKNFV